MKKEILNYFSCFVSGIFAFDLHGSMVGTVLFGVLNYMIGDLDVAVNLFAFALGLDYLSGWMKAAYHKTIHSDTGYRGILKKGGMVFVVALAYQLDKAAGTSFMRNVIISGYIANEIGSIIENFESIGSVPASVAKFFKQYQDKLSQFKLFK